MTSIQLFWLITGVTWATIELFIALKTRVKFNSMVSMEYRSERLIWLVVAIALCTSLELKQLQLAPLPVDAVNRQIIAIILFITGFILRCYAILSLGAFFSTTVTTQDQHRLIDSGPYHYIRHPAYTGLLSSFLAAGLAMGDGLAFVALAGPVTYVLIQRINLEEQWLTKHFGKKYLEYCLRTQKLIPWIY